MSVDAFVTKLNLNASGAASLLYSTCLGGSEDERSFGIAVDASGHAYVTGTTDSTDFPTLHQYQTYQGYSDAFVTKLDTNASGAASLLYSTYLGGNNYDDGYGIAVDASGYAYVTGTTYSTNFPTLHQYQTDQGFYDAFVTKLDTNASGAASLLYSTYLGGENYDVGYGIAVDASSNVYVTGVTVSPDFPTLHQYQTNQVSVDAFVTKLNLNASGAASLLYSTCLGGSEDERSFGIAVDASGHAYVAGTTDSTDFPTLHQYQTYQGYNDAFVMKLTYSDSYTISGRVTSDGATGISGVTMTLSGSQTGTSVTNSTGHYSLAGLAVGDDYTVTPSKDGLIFVPSQQNVTNLQADRTNVNFTIQSTIMSGRVTSDGATGISDVKIAVSGSMPGTAVTDSNGTYYIDLGIGGNYTVTPSKYGFTFVPSQQSITNLRANQTNVDFTTRPVTISGKVRIDTATGAGLAGVTVTLTGSEGFTPRTVTTSSDGTYSFSNVPVLRNYRVTPSKPNYAFTPSQVYWSNLTTNKTQNFIAKLKSYTIGGVVKLGAAGLSGVTMTLTSPTPAGFSPLTTSTSSTGAYSFTLVPAGRDYTLTPQKTGYQFNPVSKSLTNLSANQAVQFAVKVYSITGRVTRTNTTTGIDAVTVTVTSPTPAGFTALTKQTSSTGYYSFWMSLPAGRDYRITPSKSGFTFSPATRSITNLSGNIGAGSATNFTGTGP